MEEMKVRKAETDREFSEFASELCAKALVRSRITQLDEVLGVDVHKDGSYISAIGQKLGN